MKVKGIDLKTGKTIEMDASYLKSEDLPDLSKVSLSKEALQEKLDGLAGAADVKVLLKAMAPKVIYAGKTVIRIGQKVVEGILRVLESYPNLGVGLVFGIIAGWLTSTIPFIGAVLGITVAVIMSALGLKTDFDIKKNQSLTDKERKKIAEEIDKKNQSLTEEQRKEINEEIAKFDVLRDCEQN